MTYHKPDDCVAPVRRRLAIIAAALGALAVIFGAFGAHALKGWVAERMLDVWATAVRYQMWHVLAILAAVALSDHMSIRRLRLLGYVWVAGIVVFSGSLYLLVLSGISTFGAITPIGGLLLIGGWVLFVLAMAANARNP